MILSSSGNSHLRIVKDVHMEIDLVTVIYKLGVWGKKLSGVEWSGAEWSHGVE